MKNLEELALKECKAFLNAVMNHLARLQAGDKGGAATRSAVSYETAELERNILSLIDRNEAASTDTHANIDQSRKQEANL